LRQIKENDTSQARVTKANEQGEFEFSDVQAGTWVAVASGRVGVNEAAWYQQLIVEPGKHVEVKLISPDVACADLQ